MNSASAGYYPKLGADARADAGRVWCDKGWGWLDRPSDLVDDAFVKYAAFPGITLPRVAGHEVAGRVDAVGEGVMPWNIGDRGVGWHGGHCSVFVSWRRGDFGPIPRRTRPLNSAKSSPHHSVRADRDLRAVKLVTEFEDLGALLRAAQ